MSDFPIDLPDGLAERFGRAFDVEERIPRALDALGPIAGRDVLLLDTPIDGLRASQLRARDARVTAAIDPTAFADGSVDVVIALWSALDGPGSSEEAAAMELVRPGGRVLAVRDYGRDDMASLRDTSGGSRPSGSPARLEAPFIAGGWKIRVIHCFWTFASLDEARAFAGSFGDRGRTVGQILTRPRLTHNLALYHRTVSAPS